MTTHADKGADKSTDKGADRLSGAAFFHFTAGIVRREMLRFIQQRERFIAALVRPLVWLFIFAAGFRSVLGVSIIPPYETYVLYEEYITPGLIGMIQLFSGMQTSLSMVYDREMGSMRVLLPSTPPRPYLLVNTPPTPAPYLPTTPHKAIYLPPPA